MLNKKRQEQLESVRNATTGYAAVVLTILCFVLVLMVTIALTRFFVGLGLAADTATTAQNSPTTTLQAES